MCREVRGGTSSLMVLIGMIRALVCVGKAVNPSGTYKVVTLAGPDTENVIARHGSMKDALRSELGRLLQRVDGQE